MTKLGEVAPKYEPLADGMVLKISDTKFDRQTFDGDEVDRVVVTSEGKQFTTTSKVIIAKLKTSEVQEHLAKKDADPLECKVVATKSKKGNRTYLDLE